MPSTSQCLVTWRTFGSLPSLPPSLVSLFPGPHPMALSHFIKLNMPGYLNTFMLVYLGSSFWFIGNFPFKIIQGHAYLCLSYLFTFLLWLFSLHSSILLDIFSSSQTLMSDGVFWPGMWKINQQLFKNVEK